MVFGRRSFASANYRGRRRTTKDPRPLMIVAMQESATEEQIQQVVEHLIEMGFSVHRSTGARQTVVAAVGARVDFDIRNLEVLSGVEHVHRISAPYKLAGRSFRPQGTVVQFSNGLKIGGQHVVVMAGPCSVESRDQLFATAERVAKAGARVLRGGAFKPRSSPYSFQGLGLEALKLLREAGERFGLLVISEVMEISQIAIMLPFVDILQVGARNMQNFNLLRELGKVKKPVLLKRGIAATLEELLLSAEYIMAGGNYDVILCERGIRTFETYTRNTLDISAIPVIHKLSHLPMASDPSHGIGIRDKVAPMARASLAAGADVLLIEVHHDPEKALSDGAQSLYPDQFSELMDQLRMIAPAVGRKIA
jgi:3-deoxy-7-phosphoheptulonate synthase